MSGGTIGGTLGTALGVALAPATGGMSLAIPGLAGAAGSALGGALTGSDNIWRDALMGGIGGTVGGGLNNLSGNASGLGDLFNTGSDINGMLPEFLGGSPAGASLESIASGVANPVEAGRASLESAMGLGGDSVINGASSVASQAANPAATTIGGKLLSYAPYAGIGLGSMMLDNASTPKQVGPAMQEHPRNPGRVSPLARTQQNIDPNSYFAQASNPARNYYDPYSMEPQFLARGGLVRGFADGGSSSASSSNIPPMGRRVRGAGDGQSDSIPARLSDGEFVVSAPVVSALGNGSNDAGAKKLDKLQKNVLNKHYKGGKTHKAVGLASYVH